MRKLKSELIVKIQCVIILTKLDINKDFLTARITPQTEGAFSNLPFPLSAAIIMHLQQKEQCEYF